MTLAWSKNDNGILVCRSILHDAKGLFTAFVEPTKTETATLTLDVHKFGNILYKKTSQENNEEEAMAVASIYHDMFNIIIDKNGIDAIESIYSNQYVVSNGIRLETPELLLNLQHRLMND